MYRSDSEFTMELFYLAKYEGNGYTYISGPYPSWNSAWSNRYNFQDEHGAIDVVSVIQTVRR